MLNELMTESEMTVTENGCAAFRSTGSFCLDLFSFAGALRSAHASAIIDLFIRAYAESPDTAMKILFFARDIREGLGEKRFFRIILKYAAFHYPKSVIKNIPLIAEYGRFDDLMMLADTPCKKALGEYLNEQLLKDTENMAAGKPVSLLGKWLPSCNTSSDRTKAYAASVRRLLGLSEKKYRKTLSALRSYIDVLEKRLCKMDYTFDYSKQPSKALFKYRQAFLRNDSDRYNQFIENVKNGKTVMHTSSLYPYDIIRACEGLGASAETAGFLADEIDNLDVTWHSLTDHSTSQNAIAVVDGSGSMYSDYASVRPIDAAVSLGIYFAEHSKGSFANHFITFSQSPRMIELKGKNIYEKAKYCMSFCEVSTTNIAAVFRLILRTAVKNNVPPQEMPDTIYIISDMEFDYQSDNSQTAFNYAKKLFEKYGYKLPAIVFWNVESRREQCPVRMDTTGAVLLSGASPVLFRYAVSGSCDPVSIMNEIIFSERYRPISA